ncbi:MAG: sulfite exporter TauE/SafE family protein [Ignavibacteriae bacterium]|nr:sulfite exporter TauE/SafE family protein [Ignavibacteriota bacterium]
MIDPGRAALLIGAGFVAGVMNSIAGGGTIVTFPALIFSGLQSIVANATSTVALLPASLSSLLGYRKRVAGVTRWLQLFSPVSLVGGLLGGILLTKTPTQTFDWLVPFLILFATVLFMSNTLVSRYLLPKSGESHGEPSRHWIIGAVVFQFFVGVYGGYFGAGIGILMLASFGLLGFSDVHEMNTVKVVLGFLLNVVAALYFAWSGIVDWSSAGVMVVGTIIGGYVGAHFAQKVPQKLVRSLITAIGLALSAVMFYKQFVRG